MSHTARSATDRARSERRTHPSERSLRKVFEPIPRGFAYAMGFVLVLVVLTPFWLSMLIEKFERKPILISEDTANQPPPPASSNATPGPLMTVPSRATTALDQYRGVRLEGAVEELAQKLGLRLQNARGMVPEVYVADKAGDFEHVTAHIYHNKLKEAFVVEAEKRVLPGVVEKQLSEEFGPPQERLDLKGGSQTGGLGTTPVAAVIGGASGELTRRLDSFPRSRYLAWFDDQNRVEATIYYSSIDPDQCTSILSLHLSAVGWLNANRPQLGTLGQPPAPAGPQPIAPPKQLFP